VARFEGTGSPFISIYDTNVRQFYAYSGSDFQLMVDTNKNLSFGTNSATQMTLDTSGNLGLGVTPSAWASFKALELKTNAFISWQGGGSGFGSINYNAYYNGGYKRIGTDYASQYYQQTGCHFFGSAGSGSAGSAVTFSPTLTINANGALALQGATIAATGVGITFPATQSASSDANTLDDYEEGTWTPVLSAASGSAGGYSTQNGRYTKIGNVVKVSGYIQLSSVGSLSGGIFFTGLPFATNSVTANSYQKGSVRFNGLNALSSPATGLMGLYSPPGATSAFVDLGISTGISSVSASVLVSSTDAIIEFTYLAAT
jgi:hypothetical protein